MRALFVSAPLPGHLDWGGFLRTAAAWQAAGHTALWVSGEAVAPLVRAEEIPFAALNETGWRWPPPPPLPAPTAPEQRTAWQAARAVRALDQWLDAARVAAAVDELTTLAERFQPDLIVSEMFVAAAGMVAERLGVPFAVAGWPALDNAAASPADPLAAIARQRLERLLARWQLTGQNWTAEGPPALRSPHLHLTYWCATWYRGLALLPQTAHVGGAPPDVLPPLPDLPDPEELPWVLITLGTSFDDDPAFYVAAAKAAHQLGCLPLLVGRSILEQAGGLDLPPVVAVRDSVDFRRVLPYTVAAIHHGGAGIGLHLPPRTVTSARLAAALAALLPDLSEQRHNAEQLRSELTQLGGAAYAAVLLEKTVTG